RSRRGSRSLAGLRAFNTNHAAQARSSAAQGRKSSMKHTRIIVTQYGGPDALQVVEEECPEPKAGEVRVRVLAAGVSLPDIMARRAVWGRNSYSLGASPGWRCTVPVHRGGAPTVSILGGIPIDYQHQDFVKEVHRLSEGVDVVFDPIGGTHIWRSRKALRPG